MIEHPYLAAIVLVAATCIGEVLWGIILDLMDVQGRS
jgi:hypothetical protein